MIAARFVSIAEQKEATFTGWALRKAIVALDQLLSLADWSEIATPS